jgi:predicted metal-dependent phosphoesterase TrpH
VSGAADLHLHSLISDGTADPAEVVRRAAACGIQTLAVADHDDTRANAPALATAKELGVTLVPSIELTARVDQRPGGTVHILGYGIASGSEALEKAALANRLGKRTQIVGMLERLRELGISLTDEEVGFDRSSDAYVGRNRIASALVVRGLAKNRLKAFKRYLEPGARAFIPPVVVDAVTAITAIHSAGGLAVLAHPTGDDLDRHLGKLCDAGLDGIEVYRPRAQGGLLERIERARERRNLLATGGSDWHGHYPGVPLGEWKVDGEKIRPFLERFPTS